MAVDALGWCHYQWVESWGSTRKDLGQGQGRGTPDLGGGTLGRWMCTMLSQGGPRLGLRVTRGGTGDRSSLAKRGPADRQQTQNPSQSLTAGCVRWREVQLKFFSAGVGSWSAAVEGTDPHEKRVPPVLEAVLPPSPQKGLEGARRGRWWRSLGVQGL